MNLPFRLLVIPFVLGFASAAVAGVRIVGQAPSDDATIQLAIDLASDGDVVLVRPGAHARFTIDDKSLTVAGLRPGTVTIQGTIEVKNLASWRTVLLADLAATGPNAISSNPPGPGLWLSNDAGAVRVHASTLIGGKGGWGSFTLGPGAHGAAVSGCVDVAIAGSTLKGSLGGNDNSSCVECHGGQGGDGLNTQTSAVALYDCTLEGGRGGNAGNTGGKGGNGAAVVSWGIFASRSTFRGGTGGNIWDFLPNMGGHGGDGLVVAAGAGAKLLDSATLGGTGGQCYLCRPVYAPDGQGTSGAGLFQSVPGMARRFATRALAAAPGALAIEVDGAPGDRVYVTGGPPDFRFKWGWHGVWLVHFPAPISTTPLGTIDSSGSGVFALPMSALPAGTGHALACLQGVVISTQGQAFISSPLTVTLLDCATLQPDCDGDGTFDGCELAFGSIVDADANGVEDACDPDCNANGVLDSLDVSAHTSSDLNANHVPDECEPAVATWYVDPAASANGDGSLASPFQNLAQASYAALGGHTIVLRDGLYSGASNRGFVFNGRNLAIRSANGPAACVIDLESAGRAFLIANGESAAARVEGLTIRKGVATNYVTGFDTGAAIKVTGASPTIQACVFEDNLAIRGGALYLSNSDALVRDCLFRANRAPSQHGGAIYVSSGHPRIVGCTFVENSAESGGAIALVGSPGVGLVVSHCVFHKNSVARYGGAAFVTFNTAVFEHCLFTENRGTAVNSQGGAVFAATGALFGISSCTLARNSSMLHGGGIYVEHSGAGTLRDSIVWNNVCPGGSQIALLASSPSTASLAVAYCDVEGGEAAVFRGGSTSLTWGAGNLDVEPAFVDPDGSDDDPVTLADNDWRLSLASPCIDAGDNALVAIDWADIDGDGDTSELAPLDLDLAPRFADVASVPDTGNGTAPIVDLGCYERQ